MTSDAYAIVPAAMAGEALVDQESGMGGKMVDGRVGTVGSVAYLDDAAFDDYAKSLGLNPADFRDPEHLRAIALARGYGNNGSVYQLLDILREPGTLEVVEAVTYHGERRRASASVSRPERAMLRPSPSNPILKVMTTGSNGSRWTRRTCRRPLSR